MNILQKNKDFIFKGIYVLFLTLVFFSIINIIISFSFYPIINKAINTLGKDIEEKITRTLPKEYFQKESKYEKNKIILNLALDEIKPYKQEIKDFFCK